MKNVLIWCKNNALWAFLYFVKFIKCVSPICDKKKKKRKYLKGGKTVWFCNYYHYFYTQVRFVRLIFKLGVKYGADLLLRPPCSRFVLFFYAAIPQALLHVTLMILQSTDLQMNKGPESLCVPIQYIPISIVGKLVSLPISISFSKSLISAWVGF